MNSFYTKAELETMGFKKLGNDVCVSRKASIYGSKHISIGDHVRIDDFCILSGKIEVGCYIHIAAYSALYGGEKGIYVHDYSNISSRVCIYAVSDDYSGNSMTNPLIPEEYKFVEKKEVMIDKHVIIGCGSVVLPGSVLSEGTAVGAMSLIKCRTKAWSIYAGIPAILLKQRSNKLLKLANDFEKTHI